MEHIINITQELTKTGDASCVVKIEIESDENVEVIEFNYENTNFIFPYYNSLINAISKMKDVHIELKTDSEVFAKEVRGNPNKNTRLLEILKNIQERRNITIDAE